MNYYAHGRAFVDDPYFLAGTALPDWLSVVNRKVRLRTRHAEPYLNDADRRVASFAAGLARHHADDAWFHETRAFHELCWSFARRLVEFNPADDGFRPSFLAHILVELLLDATLIAESPERAERYYAAAAELDAEWIEDTVHRWSAVRPEKLAWFIGRFVEARFLFDYLDDGRLVFRLNQVLGRVGLAPLDDRFGELLPDFRRQVAERAEELLRPGFEHDR